MIITLFWISIIIQHIFNSIVKIRIDNTHDKDDTFSKVLFMTFVTLFAVTQSYTMNLL